MTTCELCGRPLEAGSNNNYIHYICRDDENSRFENGKCMACGENPIDYNGRCTNCLKDGTKPQHFLGPR